MKKILIIIIIVSVAHTFGRCADSTSIYSYNITTIDGTTVNLGNYAGKKILFVNVATGSQYVNQLAELETLYQQYKDSLVVIAFPSNDFGNESNDDSTIQANIANEYGIHYILAAKTNIAGVDQNPLIKWLTTKSLNGVFENPILGDFYKILVDRTGQAMAVFNERVHVTDAQVQGAITY